MIREENVNKSYADGGADYSCRCGWIDWSHATWDRRDMVSLWAQLPHARKPGDADERHYEHFRNPVTKAVEQGLRVSVRHEAYKVTSSWLVPERSFGLYEELALAMYQSMCEFDEEGQPWFASSSFSYEDLISNLLSFYQHIYGLARGDPHDPDGPGPKWIREVCVAVDKAESKRVWNNMHSGANVHKTMERNTNRNWQKPVLFNHLCEECKKKGYEKNTGLFPEKFQRIQPAKLSKFRFEGDAWFLERPSKYAREDQTPGFWETVIDHVV